MSMLFLELPNDPTDTTLPNPLLADPILDGDDDGIRALFDLAAASSWPTLADPADGAAIHDLTGGTDLTAKVTDAATDYVGGGFDFAATSAAAASRPNGVLAPANALTSIAAAANDYFLVCGYFKLPAVWNPSSGLHALFCATAGSGGYTAEADLVTIAMNNTGQLVSRRQTNGGSSVDQILITVDAAHLGQVAQLAFWRNATNQTLRLKTAAGVQSATAATGSNNSGDFSAKQPRWGMNTSFAATDQRKDIRLYRGYIDDLNLDTRPPATILDNDWTTVSARFS